MSAFVDSISGPVGVYQRLLESTQACVCCACECVCVCACYIQILAAAHKSPKPSISQTPCLLIRCNIKLLLLDNCHWWRKKKNNISFCTICGKLKSMRPSTVIKMWSDHWRPTMTTNTKQSSFFEQTKLLSGLNFVHSDQDNGNLLIAFGIYAETLTF